MTLMQRKSPLIKVMFYVGMRSSSLCMRRLTLREKKKYPPTRLVQELDIPYNEQTVCSSRVQHLKGTK